MTRATFEAISATGMSRSDFAKYCNLTERSVRALNNRSFGAGIAKVDGPETAKTFIPFNQIPLGLVAMHLQRLGAPLDLISIMLPQGKLSARGVWTYRDKGGITIRIDTKEAKRWLWGRSA